MKKSKRFKQAMHSIRMNKCAVALGKSFAEFEKKQMQESGPVRELCQVVVVQDDELPAASDFGNVEVIIDQDSIDKRIRHGGLITIAGKQFFISPILSVGQGSDFFHRNDDEYRRFDPT